MKLRTFAITKSLFIVLFFSGCAYSQNTNIPNNIIGKAILDFQKEESNKISNISIPLGPDTDELVPALLFKNTKNHSLIILDENRDGIIDKMIVNDAYYFTDKGIRVGDKVKNILRAYPKAEISTNSDGLLNVRVIGEGIEFSFDNTGINLMDVVSQGGHSLDVPGVIEAPIRRMFFLNRELGVRSLIYDRR